MAIELNEPIIAELVSRLQADLPTEIATINAGITDGFQIEVPAHIYDHVPDVGQLLEFPTIGVGDGPSRFEDDIGSSATGCYDLLVVVFIQDPEIEGLTKRLRRTVKAITRVALEGRRLSTAAWGVGLRRVDPGPTLTDNPDHPRSFVSWSGITIWAKTDED